MEHSRVLIDDDSVHQGSAWDGTVPSHPIPSHGTFFQKIMSHGMGWDGKFWESSHPMGRRFFYPIPSHPMGQKFSVKILDLLIYWGKNNFTDVDVPFGHSSETIKEIIVFYYLSGYTAKPSDATSSIFNGRCTKQKQNVRNICYSWYKQCVLHTVVYVAIKKEFIYHSILKIFTFWSQTLKSCIYSIRLRIIFRWY